jgi:hypothetical protein
MFGIGRKVYGFFGVGTIIGNVTTETDDEPRWRVSYAWAVVDEPEMELTPMASFERDVPAHECA